MYIHLVQCSYLFVRSFLPKSQAHFRTGIGDKLNLTYQQPNEFPQYANIS